MPPHVLCLDLKQNNNQNNWKIPLYKIYTDDEDVNLITKIAKRGTYWAIGPEIEELENAIKDYVGTDYCVTLNSGTSALHATYLAYGFGQGDEIIVPSFSFISTANSVLFVDAKPCFADIETENCGLDPKSISQKITQKTKAVVPMDYGGLSCKIFDIKQTAIENNLILIEDAAEALAAARSRSQSSHDFGLSHEMSRPRPGRRIAPARPTSAIRRSGGTCTSLVQVSTLPGRPTAGSRQDGRPGIFPASPRFFRN